MKLEITINKKLRKINVAKDMPLLWIIRDLLGLIGTKFGCGMGLCGACTVHLNGEAVRSCLIPAKTAHRQVVTTIEGLDSNIGARLFQSWKAVDVPQCGYCQPGQIMAAAALLTSIPKPSQEQVKKHMNGNLCRCGSYNRILAAILRAAS